MHSLASELRAFREQQKKYETNSELQQNC